MRNTEYSSFLRFFPLKARMVAASTKARFLAFFTTSTARVIAQVTPDMAIVETYASPKLSLCGHLVLGCLYFLLTGTYASFIFYQWGTRPPTQTFSQVPSAPFGGIPIYVTAECSNTPFCGNVTITSNYSVSRTAACAATSGQASVIVTDPLALRQTPLPLNTSLCFTGEQVFTTDVTTPISIAGVIVDFSAVNPGMNKALNVADPTMKAVGVVKVFDSRNGDLLRIINLDSWQVKTLVMGVSVNKVLGVVKTDETTPFPIAVQYEGKRPNWRATLIITLAPYVNLVSSTKTPNYTILGEIGSVFGASLIAMMLLSYVEPLVVKVCPGPATLEERKRLAAEVKLADESEMPLKSSTNHNDGGDMISSERSGGGHADSPITKPTAPAPKPTGGSGAPRAARDQLRDL